MVARYAEAFCDIAFFLVIEMERVEYDAAMNHDEGLGCNLQNPVCVGIGEWLESSYYIGVLRWSEQNLR